ncbi:MAG: reprolysin-like metallopeptidase [Luminiphilus sp.]
MEFSLCERSALRRSCLSVFLTICPVFCLPVMSAGDALTLQLTQADQLPQTVTSLKQLNARAGDMLSLSSEFGEDFAFRVETSRRSNHGNKVIRGVSEAGGRLTMVVTSDGQLQGSLREAGNTYRLVQEGSEIVWHYADPYLARPVDRGGLRMKRSDRAAPAAELNLDLQRMERTVLKDLSDETVHYPVFGSGTATLDLLFYHEAGMETPEAIADLVTEITNQAMLDSQIALRANVVAVKPLEIDPAKLQEDVLDQMFEAEAPFTDIESDRAFYDADLVVALRENIPEDDDACGIAPVGVQNGVPYRDAYVTVVQWLPIDKAPGDTYCTDTTTAHEIGHLLGSSHERRIAEEEEVQAYPFSFGHYREGVFHTIMSYGTEPESAVFSSPKLSSCSGQACGVAAGDPESADNARGFTQTRFMLAGYQSNAVAPELVSDFRVVEGSLSINPDYDGACERDDGSEGVKSGHAMLNQTPHTIEIRGFSALTPTGSTETSTYEPEEVLLGPNAYQTLTLCEPAGGTSRFGTDYVESWMTYYDPTTDKLIESLHLLWDADYSGTYAEVRTTSSSEGAAAGHTTRRVKSGESLTVNFSPANGYRLLRVDSSCGGSLQGNAFTVQQVVADCLLEPKFEPALAAGETLRLALEEPVAGSVYSGVGNLRGWSVATVGIDRIEIWFDGVYAFDAPYGGARGDVGNIFPDIDNSSSSGFSLAWNYSNMAPGEHVITARAYNQNGQFTESSSTFTVTRFHKPFLGAGDQVDLSEAQCSVSDSQISLGDAVIDGKVYDILLDWRTAAQDFQIIEIR